MPRAIRIHEAGGPEVMRLEEVEVPAPGAGQVQVEHTAIGLNFIDVYDRIGPVSAGDAGGSRARSRGNRSGGRARACADFASAIALPM